MTGCNELESMWKEAAVAYIKVLPPYLPEEAKENYEYSQSG